MKSLRKVWIAGLVAGLYSGLAGAQKATLASLPVAAAPAWVEVTPLASNEPASLLSVSVGQTSIPLRNPPEGLALVCFGGEEIAVSCRQSYLEADASVAPEIALGVRLAGTVVVGDAPATGASVALVPKQLRSRRFVTLPLRRDGRAGPLVRETRVGPAGRFKTPQIAPGDYLLEIKLPGGRIRHGEPFTVPHREALLPKGRQKPGAEAVLDLGRIEFDKGVKVEVFAHGPGGEPLAKARVGGSQGQLDFFESATGPDGKAALSGLDGLAPIRIRCLADGYREAVQSFEVPPAAVDCALERLAALRGSVVTGDGEPVSGATVDLPGTERRAGTNADGQFEVAGLVATEYRVVVTAPGFKVERTSVTLEPGQARQLPPIALLPAPEVECLVRDGRTKEPIAGATVVSLAPAGLVSTTTDAAGICRFGLGEEERTRLAVTAEGYARGIVELDPAKVPQEGPWPVELRSGGRILARVWDEESDGPCQGCLLNFHDDLGTTGSLTTDRRGEALSEALAEGTYSVSPTRVQSLGSVVQVQGGFDTKKVSVRSGEITTVQFGEAARKLRIRLRPAPPEDWHLFTVTAGARRSAERTGGGVFEVRQPAGRPILLELNQQSGVAWIRLAALTDEEIAPTLDLPLPQTEVRGTLADGSGAGAAKRVQFVSAERGELVATATSSADGSFRLPFLPAGTYTLLVGGQPVRSFQITAGEALDLGTVASPQKQ